jgi:hypothetical protein
VRVTKHANFVLVLDWDLPSGWNPVRLRESLVIQRWSIQVCRFYVTHTYVTPIVFISLIYLVSLRKIIAVPRPRLVIFQNIFKGALILLAVPC